VGGVHTVLGFPIELPTIVYTTDAVESLNSRFCKSVQRRTHVPNESAALKVLYLVAQEKKPGRSNTIDQINGWKTILNVLTIQYGDRIADINNQ
jgi:transposase-like protein